MSIFKQRVQRLGGLLGARMQHQAALVAKQDARDEERTGLDGFNFARKETCDEPTKKKPVQEQKGLFEDPTGGGMLTQKDAEGLAAHYGDEEHPFTACMNDPKMVDQYPDEERRARVCGAMKATMRAAGNAPEQRKKMIEERDGEYVVLAKSTGKVLGRHATRAEAEAQLAAIEASKARAAKQDEFPEAPVPTAKQDRSKYLQALALAAARSRE